MGSGNSARVSLFQNEYNPGDTVSGELHINIVSPLDVKEVFVVVTGREQTEWTDFVQVGTGEQRRSVPMVRRGGKEFIKLRVPLWQEYRRGMVGQYTLPFSISLPTAIPGSFTYTTDGISASVAYTIKGVVDIDGMLRSDIEDVEHFHVIERPHQIQRMKARQSEQVMVCCCVNKGRVEIEVNCDKSAYAQHENIQVSACINNDSNVAVQGLTLELISTLEVTASGGESQTRTKVVAHYDQPGVAAKQSVVNKIFTLAVPPSAQQQCLGYHIRHFYHVQVRTKIDWAADPVCKIPIGIYQPSPASAPTRTVAAVADWQPQTLPVVRIVLPPTAAPPPLQLQQFGPLVPMGPSVLYSPAAPPLVVPVRQPQPVVMTQPLMTQPQSQPVYAQPQAMQTQYPQQFVQYGSPPQLSPYQPDQTMTFSPYPQQQGGTGSQQGGFPAQQVVYAPQPAMFYAQQGQSPQ